jgi:hypothetical protein
MLAKTFVFTFCALFLGSPHVSAAQKQSHSSQSEAPPPEGADVSEDLPNSDERGPSLSGNFLSLGPGISGNLFPAENDPGSMAYSFTGGHAWDVRGAMLTLGGDLQIQGDALMVDAGLGARFFTSENDIAPYLGGFFGLGVAKGGSEGLFSGALTGGFATGGDVGVQLFRTSDIHLDLGASFRVLLATLIEGEGSPWTGALHVGLFF